MARARGRSNALAPSSARVHFAADFVRRLEAFTAEFASSYERREGARAGHAQGEGAEFVGYRPYREGEDLRRVDWNLFARLDRPFVRVTRREIGGEWRIALDTSASMMLGQPSKLQRAAEAAAAIACVGLRAGARVTFVASSGAAHPFVAGRLADLGRALQFLETLDARGVDGLGALVARGVDPRASAWFALGDGLDLEPERATSFARATRRLSVVLCFAREELAPSLDGARRLIDPESGEELELEVEPRVRSRYLELVEARLERWRRALASVDGNLFVGTTEVEFERFARGALGG